MAYSQQPQMKTSNDALPNGYTLSTHIIGSTPVDRMTIDRVLREDEFSISYLVSLNTSNTEIDQGAKVAKRILVEFFPRTLSHRDPDTYNITLNSASCQEEYEWGLLTYLNKAKSFLKINHPNIVNIKHCFKAHNTVYVLTDSIYENAAYNGNNSNSKENDQRKGKKSENNSANPTNNWTTLINHTNDKRLAEEEILSLTTQLLDALDKVHSTGQILSDLTPSSILIQPETGQAVIAHLADPKHIFRHYNKAIAQNISPGYSACEQYYASDKQGSWTDIYAMGSILYKIISGTTPDSAAYRLTHFTDLNKDSLIPATKIKHSHNKAGGSSKYSTKLLKAIDHAMQLQSIDRPQTVHEWQEELGIKTSSPSISGDSGTAHNSDKSSHSNSNSSSNSRAEIMGLSIPGVTHSPTNFIQVPNKNVTTDNDNDSDNIIIYTDTGDSEVDFVALSQLPVTENRPNKNINLAIGITAVVLASLFGAYYYISQPAAHYQPQFQPKSEPQQHQPQLDDFASKSNDPSIVTDSVLETTSLKEIASEEKGLVENVLNEESLNEKNLNNETDEESSFKVFNDSRSQQQAALSPHPPQTPLTPLWLLDVPLVTKLSTTEEHPHYLIDSTIKSIIIGYPFAHKNNKLVSLKNAIRLNNNPYTLASIVSSSTSTTETTAEKANDSEQVKAQHAVTKTSVARSTNNHRPKKQKTRLQYQRDWALKQRKKALAKNRKKHPQKRPHGKTQKHYQNEWKAKQQQLKKVAAWKRRKQQLEMMEIRKTTSQIERQLLNDNDW